MLEVDHTSDPEMATRAVVAVTRTGRLTRMTAPGLPRR